MDTESTSSSSQTTTTNNNQADNRKVLAEGALLAENNSSITVTTLDADVAKAALSAGTKGMELAFNFGSKSQGQALDSLESQASMVKDAYADAKGRGALTDKILIGAIAMAGLVAIAALRK